MLEDKDLVSVQQARQAVERASKAAQALKAFTQEQVDSLVEAISRAGEKSARQLAELAVEETGYGKVEDKTVKNLFCSVDVARYALGLKTVGVISENKEKRVIDIAVPVGVVVAIIPTTNPTSTAIFKIICAIKGGNSVVVGPHPRAVRCTVETARVLYLAALAAGAPQDCITWLDQVTLEGTTALMRHKKTNLILATGGPGLVRAAYSSGKPAYGVGPGNVPAFIERTAEVPKAVRDVLAGKTFDWGVLCSSEQAIVCDRPIEGQVLEELKKNNAYLLNDEEIRQVEKMLVQGPGGTLNRDVVGQCPQKIARLAGFSVPDEVICLVGRAKGVGKQHPLSMEKLSPILAFYVEDGWEAGCRRCIEILSYGGLGHTMSIHSRDDRIILEFGLHKPAYRICVNTPSTHGSVGLTTGVPPSMTLGCGSPGGNITSDNITPMHLVNIKRLAYEIRPVEQIRFDSPGRSPAAGPPAFSPRVPPSARTSTAKVDLESVRQVVRGVVEQYLDEKKKPSPQSSAPAPSPEPQTAQPEPAAKPPAVDFVCEDDVKQALRSGAKIVINDGTILTPAARDAAAGQSVLEWE